MNVLIRPIARDDVRGASLVIQGGSLSPEVEDETNVDAYWSAVEETRRRHGDVLIAEVNGEVAGVCQVIIFQQFQHTGAWCCELESVHVRSDLRGHGVGTKLLAEAEMLARRAGCYRLQLTSRNVRLDAHRFYVTNGFEQTSQGFKKKL
ncbi:MAG TPA: GNAT family N-acetyltransferase [Acidimicrobiales bacterium]|jgi:GNAT superfamily N-acetyltransferase|nr:GNAT family N-acetyltransferase [Acidimicrobiales bacterium]